MIDNYYGGTDLANEFVGYRDNLIDKMVYVTLTLAGSINVAAACGTP